jgi:hypothetical protein
VAILQFLTAAELIESDLWQQYNELGGIDAGNSGYVAALGVLDGDIMAGGGKSRLRGFIPGDARAAASTESVPCAAAPINQPTANATGSIKVSPRVRRATNHGQAGDADHRWPGVAVVTHVRGGMTDDPDVATTPMISHSTHSSAKSWRPSTGRSPATHGSTAQ